MIGRMLAWAGRSVSVVRALRRRVHDYRTSERRSGHDYVIEELLGSGRMRIHGWGRGVRRGDLLLMSRDGGGVVVLPPTVAYRVESIRYGTEPIADRWEATVRFVSKEDL